MSVKRWGKEDNVGKSLYAVSMESNRQGSLTGLVNLNNSGSLWGPGAVPSCLVWSPGVIMVGG